VPLEIFDHSIVGPLACNCYIVGDPETRAAIVIDPGGDPDVLQTAITSKDLNVTAIVATHAHFDHIIAAEVLRSFTGAPFYLHARDVPLLDWYSESGLMFLGIELPPPPEIDTSVSEGDELHAGSVTLSVLHTPGHSPGSISLINEAAIFSGDTLFAGSIGRSDLPGGDSRALIEAIRGKLFPLGDDLPVYPGHGPATTIERERATNPFVGEV
jgi:glyoxylase-like metal-dependent hydrolase (beta-lactamase superfamily II)